MELKDKVKALAKVIKNIVVTFKLIYSSIAAKALSLLVILIRRIREIIVFSKRETKRE